MDNSQIKMLDLEKAKEIEKDKAEFIEAFEKFSSKYSDNICGFNITKFRHFNWQIEIRIDMKSIYA